MDLFKALFSSAAISGRYSASRALADERGERLRIVLRVNAPELAALPWEAMYDDETGSYVCRRQPLVRHVPVAAPPPPLRVQGPLRILAVVSSPRGLDPLDVEGERANLTSALSTLAKRGAVQVDWVDDARWSVLQDKLLGDEWHVVHFIGHGDFDIDRDEGVLALVGSDGRVNRVEANRIVDLLREARPMPRLVVLNSCLSGASGSDDLFSGTAAALVGGGVNAVAAMQFAISDLAAIDFCRGFYTAVARGRGLDEAVGSGRVAILGSSANTLEWVTPIIYLRGKDANLFTIETVAQSGEVLEDRVTQAKRALEGDDPESAIVVLDSVLAEDPSQDAAAALRDIASARARQADGAAGRVTEVAATDGSSSHDESEGPSHPSEHDVDSPASQPARPDAGDQPNDTDVLFSCTASKRLNFWSWSGEFTVTPRGIEFVVPRQPKYSFSIDVDALRKANYPAKLGFENDLHIVLRDGSHFEVGLDDGDKEPAVAAMRRITAGPGSD